MYTLNIIFNNNKRKINFKLTNKYNSRYYFLILCNNNSISFSLFDSSDSTKRSSLLNKSEITK
jgi:hypothetical protein